ncbi:MAG: hypothetical protein EOO39_12270, partial [Cytophagaceae bacterium]
RHQRVEDEVAVAIAHAKAGYIRIHPHTEGNGRMSRTISAMIAYRYGFLLFDRAGVHPPDPYTAYMTAGVDGTFDNLVDWTSRPEDGIHFYSGTATYRKTFDAPTATGTLFLDLGNVQDVGVARVRLNGQDLGIVWAPPFRVSVGKLLKPTGNQLEIDVVNSWRNRLIGDHTKPKEQRLTNTNVTVRPDWKLQPSGLLGPVQLFSASE